MTVQYSNNEIDLKFKNLEQSLEYYHDLQMGVLNTIKEQTLKTNGRVNKHDECVAKLDDDIRSTKAEMNKYLTIVLVLWAILQFGIKYFI